MEVVSRRVTSPVFVGRTAELDLLDGALERAPQAGRRSRSSAASRASARRACCASSSPAPRARRARAARAVPRAGRRADPLRAARRRVAPARARPRTPRTETLPAATRNALAELLPELGGTGTRADEEPSARQGRLFEALLALLERLGRSGPVLLAIEDLHWADGSTRDFITFLVRSAREEPLCLVVTYRSDELHRRHPLRPLLAELERAAGVERIALERFDRGELAEQLEGILPERPSADARGAALRPLAGQPAVHRGAAGRERGRRRLAAARDAARRAARARRAALARRAGRRARRRRARPADRRTGCSRPSPTSRPPRSWTARARRSPHQVLVTGDDGMYAFRHALVGEAVHGDLLPGEDTALHARIAAAIERSPSCWATLTEATVAAELACHWKSSHELSRSLGASVRAGIAAKRVYAYEVAQPPVRARARAVGARARRRGAGGHRPRRGPAAAPRPARARAARRRAPSR